eukprot:10327826-Ditylum_brightwellii.AAC.1
MTSPLQSQLLCQLLAHHLSFPSKNHVYHCHKRCEILPLFPAHLQFASPIILKCLDSLSALPLPHPLISSAHAHVSCHLHSNPGDSNFDL